MKALTFTLLIMTMALVNAQNGPTRTSSIRRDVHSASYGKRSNKEAITRLGMEAMLFLPLMEKLTPEKRSQLERLLIANGDLPRNVARPRVQQFVMTFPNEIKAQFVATHQKMEELRAFNSRKAGLLRGNAKTVYNQLTAAMNDESLSWAGSHQKILGIMSRADPMVFQQFKAAGIRMPPGLGRQ